MGPSALNRHAMACAVDDDGERVTLFGGQGPSVFQDTWRLVERG
jgi:hypothetical protein